MDPLDHQKVTKAQKALNLLRKIERGNKDAFFEIMTLYTDEIYKYCLRKLKNPQDAKDMVSLVFMKCYDHIGELRKKDSFRSYLYSIAYNDCCTKLRKMKRIMGEFSAEELPIADCNPNPEEQAMENEKQALINDLGRIVETEIDSLDHKYRDIILLIHYQNLSYKEAGEALGIPENTAKIHMHRAIKKLQKKLKPYKEHYNEVCKGTRTPI